MLCGELITTNKFGFDSGLKAIQSVQAVRGKDSVLAPLLKQLPEAALSAELDSHLADDVITNRKSGKSSNTNAELKNLIRGIESDDALR